MKAETLLQRIPNITFRQLWILSGLSKQNMKWNDLRCLCTWNDGSLYGALKALGAKKLIIFRKGEGRTYSITSEGRTAIENIYEEVYSWQEKEAAARRDKKEGTK